MPLIDEVVTLPTQQEDTTGGIDLSLPTINPTQTVGDNTRNQLTPQVTALKQGNNLDVPLTGNLDQVNVTDDVRLDIEAQSNIALQTEQSAIMEQGSEFLGEATSDTIGPRTEALSEELENSRRGVTSGVNNELQVSKALSEMPKTPVTTTESIFKSLRKIREDDPNITDQIDRDMATAAYMAASNDINAMLENVDATDRGLAAINSFLPLFNLAFEKDVFDLRDDLNASGLFDVELQPVKVFDVGATIETMSDYYNSLSPQRKATTWEPLRDLILDSTEGNILRTADILQSILNPDPTLREQATFQTQLKAFDVATLLPVIRLAKFAARASKNETNIINAAEAVDGPSADLTYIGLVDEDLAKAMNIAPEEIQMNATPFFTGSFMRGSTDGISAEVRQVAMNLEAKDNDLFTSIITEQAVLIEGGLTRVEKQARITKEIDLVRESFERDPVPDYMGMEFGVSNVTNQGFDVVSFLRNSSGSDVSLIEQRAVTFKLNDRTGTLGITQESSPSQLRSFFGSGISASGSAKELIGEVKTAIALDQGTSRLRNIFRDRLNEVNIIGKRLSKGERNDAESILIYLDSDHVDEVTGLTGKDATLSELMNGFHVKGPQGERLIQLTTPKQIEYYMSVINLGRTVRKLEDFTMRKQMVREGVREIPLQSTGATGDAFFGTPFETLANARAAFRGGSVTRFYDTGLGKMVDLDANDLENIYSSGQQIARVDDGFEFNRIGKDVGLQPNEVADYAVMSRGADRSLPSRVLKSRPGYVPRINKGIEYIVKKERPVVRQGVTSTVDDAVQFFASKLDAEQYIARQGDDAAGTLKVIGDNELTDAERINFGVGNGSGFATSNRSSREIRYGLSDSKTERLSITEAYERQVAHLSRFTVTNDWRQGLRTAWVNNVNEALELQGKGVTFDTPISRDTALGRSLNDARDRINFWTGLSTKTERNWEGLMQRFHDRALNGGRKTLKLGPVKLSVPGFRNKDSIDSILWLKHTDPFAAMKSASFHLLLGAWNPIQFFVQSQAATIALSRFPRFAGQAMEDALRMSFHGNIKNPETLKKLLKNDPDYLEMNQALQRTGMMDEVTSTNPDLNSFAKQSFGSLERLKDSSLFFYRGGENLNIRISYAAAYRKWKRDNPGKKLDKEGERAIQKESNLSRLELQKANGAQFQGAVKPSTFTQVTSTALQFQQVMTKTFELMFRGKAGGGFSTPEKLKIFTGQFFLYGAAGIPLGALGVSQVSKMLGISPEDLSEDPVELERLVTLANGGLLDLAILTGSGALVEAVTGEEDLGANVQFSNRASVLGGVPQFFRELMFSDDPLIAKALGPFGSIANKSYQIIGQLRPLATAGITEEKFTSTDLLVGLQNISQIAGTGRQLLKAHIMLNSNRILDRHGRTLIGPEDLPMGKFQVSEIIASALGFKLTDEVTLRVMEDEKRVRREVLNEMADVYMSNADKYVRLLKGQDQEKIDEQLNTFLASNKVMFNSLTDHEATLVRGRIEEMMSGPESQKTRVLLDFLDKVQPESFVQSLDDANKRMFGDKYIQGAVGGVIQAAKGQPAFKLPLGRRTQ